MPNKTAATGAPIHELLARRWSPRARLPLGELCFDGAWGSGFGVAATADKSR